MDEPLKKSINKLLKILDKRILEEERKGNADNVFSFSLARNKLEFMQSKQS